MREFFYLFRRLWRGYTRPQRGYFFWSIPLSILAGLCTAFQAYLFEPAIDKVIIAGDPFHLWFIPLTFFVVSLLRGTLIYAQNLLIVAAAEHVVVRLQQELFNQLLCLDTAFFRQYGGAPQVGRFMTDVRYIRDGAVKTFTVLPKECCTALAMLGLMAYHSLALTGIVILIMPVFFFPLRYISHRIRRIALENQEQAGQLTSILDQALGALHQIKIANRYNDENTRASSVFHRMRQLAVKITSYAQILSPFNESVKAVCFACVVVFGSLFVQADTITVGGLTSFLVAMLGLFAPIRVLININAAIQAAIAGMKRTFALLDRTPMIMDQPDAAKFVLSQGNIRLHHVCFSYDGKQPVLRDLELNISGGKTTALVGASGSGKSSILALIARFYDPNQGVVMVDGQDLRGVTQSSWHRHIAYISQEIELFNHSLGYNVAYANPEATPEKIWHVLELVGLDTLVKAMPDKLDTIIGEGGMTLSGGQRQRLAFARALLSQARIVLMDEATSALDSESERYIQSAMHYFPDDATVVVVAHRLSTIIEADQICVIDNGIVIEQGTHQVLLAEQGHYARLYRYQYLAEEL